MRRYVAVIYAIFLAQIAWSQDGGSGPSCRVTILNNAVGQPDDEQDGTVLLRVFISASTSCRAGEVGVAAFPASVCRKRPPTDLDDSKPMAFTYEPKVLTLQTTPGNISTGVIEITSGDSGVCTFNSHIADCSGIAPPGGSCKTRDLTDPQPEAQGGVERQFNRLR